MKKIILVSKFSLLFLLFVFCANVNAQFDPELLKDPFLSPSPSVQDEQNYKLEIRQPTPPKKNPKNSSMLGSDELKKFNEYGYIIYTSSDDQMISTSINRIKISFDNLVPNKKSEETVSINTSSLIYPTTQNEIKLLSPFQTPSGIEIPLISNNNQNGFRFLLDDEGLSISINTDGNFQSGIYESILQFTSLPKP